MEAVARLLDQHAEGTALPLVLVDGPELIGRVALSSITRGPFQNAHLGYWISRSVLLHNGFVAYAIAPPYIQSAGRWQDHRLYQRILQD